MAPGAVQFALVGRTYPCEAFERWAKVSRNARVNRRGFRLGQYAANQDNFPKQPKDAARG